MKLAYRPFLYSLLEYSGFVHCVSVILKLPTWIRIKFVYNQFHKTLPKSSLQMLWISVRFYEIDCRDIHKKKTICQLCFWPILTNYNTHKMKCAHPWGKMVQCICKPRKSIILTTTSRVLTYKTKRLQKVKTIAKYTPQRVHCIQIHTFYNICTLYV